MLFYELKGKGPLVVLIHGYGETRLVWKQLVKSLRKDYTLLIIDNPGFGKSVRTDLWNMQTMASELNYLLDSLGYEKATFIGHSMGGYISLEFAHQYPEKMNGLALIHSTADADSPEKLEGRKKVLEFLQEGSLRGYARVFTPNLFAPQNRTKKAWMRKAHKDVLRGSRKGLRLATQAMMGRSDRNNVYEDLDVPYLFLAGRYDEMIPYTSMLKQASKCRRAMVEIFDESGHLAMVENPNKTKKVVRDYLSWVYR